MPTAASRPIGLIAMAGALWLVATTVVSPSATLLDVWPWAMVAAIGWLAFAAGALALFATGGLVRPRLPLALGMTLWAFVVTVSAWSGPWFQGSLAACLPTAIPACFAGPSGISAMVIA